jgi:hypothetical protein
MTGGMGMMGSMGIIDKISARKSGSAMNPQSIARPWLAFLRISPADVRGAIFIVWERD